MSIFKVTNLADSGKGSLRESIYLANNKAGVDEIVFEVAGDKHTINLTSGELDITDSLIIDGSGIDKLTIDAGGLSRVFDVDDGNRDNLIDVSLSNAIVTGGKSSELKYNRDYLRYIDGNGAGIFNVENLHLSNVAVVDNIAEYYGGGISNFGNLTITNSTVDNNNAKYVGGGIYNGGDITITNSTINNNVSNYGGGISNDGNLSVIDSVIDSNVGNYGGGGINNTPDYGEETAITNVTNIVNSDITNNSTKGYADGGGIRNYSKNFLITNSNIANNSANDGGGIHNYGGEITVNRSSIFNNQAKSDGGGIVNHFGDMEIVNSTISGNTAVNGGGGIYNYEEAALEISNSTVTDNESPHGAGIFSVSGVNHYYAQLYGYGDDSYKTSTRVTITSSIIAGNKKATDIQKDRFGNFVSGGNNLIGNNRYPGIIDGVNGDLVGTPDNPIDPELDVLQDNGGRTLTHALIADSPAIGGGSNPKKLALDQREKKRVAEKSIDIGALESNAEDVIIIDGDDNDNFLFSTSQDTIINGYGRNDRIDGNQGKDTLNGGSGHDTINGDGGYDVLNGNSGDDILNGGRGINILRGGAGDDLFYVDKDENRDWIIDFELDRDKIALPDSLTYSSLEITGNVNSFIAHQGNQIAVVLDINPVELAADSF